MLGCNPAITPIEVNANSEKNMEEEPLDSTLFKKVVGSLRYLCHSRPYLCFVVGVVSRFVDTPIILSG